MIRYIDRAAGEIREEKVYGVKALRFLCRYPLFMHLIAKTSLVSALWGGWQKLPWTRSKIAPFIAEYDIDPSEFATQHFSSFNDFFCRKLKKEARPLDKEIVAPADGRYLVFPQIAKQFVVKGEEFSLENLVRDSERAAAYSDGSMVIARLCPSDYHRFHFPIDCTMGKPRKINGHLFSVNPLFPPRFAENKRVVTPLETEMGEILFIEVGATNVGTIHQTATAGRSYAKGSEKGYFSFGGSALILLFLPGKVEFAQDLVAASQQNLETLCRMGQYLCRKI
ncbi:MAG: archaetidylserine decarboxylase [Chlamydiales bacterium]